MRSEANLSTAESVPLAPRLAMLAQLINALDRATRLACFAILIAVTAIALAGAVSRYLFNASFAWTEELASWAFVWLIFLGMAIGYRDGRHISIEILRDALPTRYRPAHKFIVDMLVSYTTVMMMVGGHELIRLVAGTNPALNWPEYVKYAPIPICCAFSLLFLAVRDQDGVVRRRTWIALAFGGLLYAATEMLGYAPLSGVSPSLIMMLALWPRLLSGFLLPRL
jgi:TRAP-type C4-dicarboxylate transport system permease small subunit